MKILPRILKRFLSLLFFLLIFALPAKAQQPVFNVAITPELDKEVTQSGDLLSLSRESNLLFRTIVPYDSKLYGVSVIDPIMVYRTRETLPVTRTGNVKINVTNINGPINIGDYITSSLVPGKGQKADSLNGFVAGVALENFTDESGVELEFDGKKYRSGQITVTVGIGPASPIQIQAQGGLFGTFKLILTSLMYNLGGARDLSKIIRYILAALVAIATLIINFITFGRNVTKGIESIGRNPLAKYSIQSMIIVNVILIAVVSLGGIMLSLIILTI